ncbi:MAG: LptF/LptG family permease [Verrucomicrobia bacterium]|nr:LptF/LptG family permease [Verrucomicrobiota bacterium]
MKIIDRYMLRSLLLPLSYCLIAFSMLFIVLDLFEHLSKLLDAKAPVRLIATYYLALLLPTLEYLAPASLMLGTLYALWQLTRNNELIAMQASGLSLHRILTPFLSVALVFALSLAVVKETIGARAFVWTTSIRENRFHLPSDDNEDKNLAYYDSGTRRLWLVEHFNELSPGVLRDVKITQERADGTRVHDLLASRAEHLDGTWWFHNLRAQQYDEQDNPVGAVAPMATRATDIRELPELTESPASFAIEVRNWMFLSTWDMIRYMREHPDLAEETALRKRYDIHSRLAAPWACLVVTLFGIPAGAKTGRQSPLTGIFLAVAFFLAYYLLIQVGLMLGKRGTVAPWFGAWLSNFVFLFSGIAMLMRMR